MERSEKRMKKSGKVANEFLMGRYWTRKIALKVAYLGGAYMGNTMCAEESAEHTVEYTMVEAMKRTRLLESLEASGWARCGRTDKGVSAWANVCSMMVRSGLRGQGALQCKDPGMVPPTLEGDQGFKEKDCLEELDYVKVINKLLPGDIRIISWSPVPLDFDARFNARARMYKYFFLEDSLNIEEMRRACGFLVGTHDFRNFCEIDVANRQNWVRSFHTATVEPSPVFPGVFVATFHASSFLWHQIRLIMSVLFHIGRGRERAELVTELLDVEKNPSKPQYSMASDVPLVLYQCDYDEGVFDWRGQEDAGNHFSLYQNLYALYEESMMRTAMLHEMMSAARTPELETQRRELQHLTSKTYVPIMERNRQMHPADKILIWDKKKAEKAAAKAAALNNDNNNNEKKGDDGGGGEGEGDA